ncbi:hypothetical protein EW146_g1650 [Bondarzewia mesenterica]|uniref:Uncharacterized protein n=1 Tax=Bondarzewia mesenterica TaxID=1095465 RepID=A0A4S4M4L6_9AGAM|nr:hypothetical protein EW146_g1650 [Bondarzewia mesenterica]
MRKKSATVATLDEHMALVPHFLHRIPTHNCQDVAMAPFVKASIHLLFNGLPPRTNETAHVLPASIPVPQFTPVELHAQPISNIFQGLLTPAHTHHPRHPYPTTASSIIGAPSVTTNPFESSDQITIMIYPQVLPGSIYDSGAHPSQQPRLMLTDALPYYEHFCFAQLCFSTALPRIGPVWKDLDIALVNHLTTVGLTIPPPPSVPSVENSAAHRSPMDPRFSDLHWHLLWLSRKNTATASYNLEAHPDITAATFTLAELAKTMKRLPVPEENSLPCYGNIKGPISSLSPTPLHSNAELDRDLQNLIHPCFNVRVLATLPSYLYKVVKGRRISIPREPSECFIAECPGSVPLLYTGNTIPYPQSILQVEGLASWQRVYRSHHAPSTVVRAPAVGASVIAALPSSSHHGESPAIQISGLPSSRPDVSNLLYFDPLFRPQVSLYLQSRRASSTNSLAFVACSLAEITSAAFPQPCIGLILRLCFISDSSSLTDLDDHQQYDLCPTARHRFSISQDDPVASHMPADCQPTEVMADMLTSSEAAYPCMPTEYGVCPIPQWPLIQGKDVASLSELALWISVANNLINVAEAMHNHDILNIDGPQVAVVALTFLKLVAHLHIDIAERPIWVNPPGIWACKDPNGTLFSLLHDHRMFRVGGTDVGNAGASSFWQAAGPYYVPQFLMVTSAPCVTQWRPEGLHLSSTVIGALDSQLVDMLQPWLDQPYDQPLPTNPFHPVNQFLIEHMSHLVSQPSVIPSERSEDEHSAWTKRIILALALKHPSPWESSEFIALKDGFDMQLAAVSSTAPSFAEAFPQMSHYASAIIVTLYNRTVTSVLEVIDHINSTAMHKAADGTTVQYMVIFMECLRNYLHGVGHPKHPDCMSRELLPKEEYDSQQNNTLLRVHFFLKAITASEMLPSKDKWEIALHFRGDDPEAHPNMSYRPTSVSHPHLLQLRGHHLNTGSRDIAGGQREGL